MLTPAQNDRLVRVGPATPMGDLLRRYWMPIAGVSEFDTARTKPIRLMGEDLVLYKDLSGNYGLVQRQCPHRRADLSFGMVEAQGLRCSYHGWQFNPQGACIHQPYEDTAHPERDAKARVHIKAYPVQAKGGMLWAYMGPLPAPLLPDWEAFSWDNGFTQVVLSEVPCNWFQCQENAIDPVHFEWMHENWGNRQRTGEVRFGATHLKLDFKEFEFGFTYHRVKQDTSEDDQAWTVGRVCLWPNGFFLGEHFEWRVPIDDENTLSVTWKYTRVPREQEPYAQTSIPTWWGPVKDEHGRWIDTHVMNQDFLAWVGQGRIADRSREQLGASDRGIVAMRRRFFEEMDTVAQGGEPKAVLRDPTRNVRLSLPMVYGDQITQSRTQAEILAHPTLKQFYTSYIFQAGQPAAVREMASQALGMAMQEFDGVVIPRKA
jgi:5,5'-dehydrodivanillate O-demethylase